MAAADSEFENLPACARQYINSVVRRIRYSKKVRREVLRELINHFSDALRDCTDDQERQERAEQLIQQFGDAELLGTLIRRGKKRCRPLWKKAIIRSLQAAGAMVVFMIVYTAWFLTGKPTISVDYVAELNRMTRPAVADTENAWPHYQRALELYVEPDVDIKETVQSVGQDGGFSVDFGNLADEEQQAIGEFIEENKAAWNHIYKVRQISIRKSIHKNKVPVTPENKFRIGRRGSADSGYSITLSEAVTELRKSIQEKNAVPDHMSVAVAVAVLKQWINYSDSGKSAIWPWVQQNQASWAEYVKGSRKPYWWIEYTTGDVGDGSLISVLLPHLSDLRSLSRVGIWRARMELEKGLVEQAFADCLAVVRTGRFWQSKGFLIEQMVGVAVCKLGYQELLHITNSKLVSATELGQIQEQLESLHPKEYPLMNIETEKLCFQDTVQRCFTEGGLGGGHLIMRKLAGVMAPKREPWSVETWLWTAIAMPMAHAGREETLAMGNRLYQRLGDEMKMSPYERRQISREETARHIKKNLAKGTFLLLHSMIPSVDRASDMAHRGKALHQATVTILALRRWQLEKGQYPESLEQLLAGGYIKALPEDPYSDGILKYERRGDDFVLYSVGADFDDDGGVQRADHSWGQKEPGGDRVFWPVDQNLKN